MLLLLNLSSSELVQSGTPPLKDKSPVSVRLLPLVKATAMLTCMQIRRRVKFSLYICLSLFNPANTCSL